MRIVLGFISGVLGFLSGIVGMLVGWFGLASLALALAGPDRTGGKAMGPIFNISLLGALIGFALGVWLFVKFGLVAPSAAPAAAPASAASPGAAVAPPKRRISLAFAVAVLAIVGGLSWWFWYEFIRSPYLTHGYMTLALQFKLPADMAPPAEAKDVQVLLDEGGHLWPGYLNSSAWHGHQGDRFVILASATMMYRVSRRTVTLTMPGIPDQSWTLSLASDPDPTEGYTAWVPSRDEAGAIELNYRLTAER
jgi:hypothetical protein